MNTINVENCKTLLIGRRGENEVTTVAFDFTEWASEFGSGVVDLYVKRFGDDSAYPVVLTIDGTVASWLVTETDTNVAGYGKAEYVYRVDGKIAKSAVFPFFVAEDIGQPASEPPDPYESWLEQLTALGAETEAHAQAAEQSAENAAESAEDAAQSATSAEGYAWQAETAAGLAQAAQTASEAARDAAQTAQASAESSATAASGSAASAAGSATAAAGSASDASASATAAGASATTASTAATQAEAAKTAAQAAQSAAEDAAEDAQQAAQQAHVEYEQLSGEVDDLSDEVAQQKSAIEDLTALVDRKAGALIDTASGAVASFVPDSTIPDLLGVTVDIEPVQDLHGYDSPWPAGGGRNKLPYATIESPLTKNGITFAINQDGSIAVNGTSTASFAQSFVNFALQPGSYYFNCGNGVSMQPNTYIYIRDMDNSRTLAEINSSSIGRDITFSIDAQTNVWFYMVFGASDLVISGTLYPMIRLATETDATFAPYENLCPISGWDAVEVERTGKNLVNPETIIIGAFVRAGNTSDSSPLGGISSNPSWSCSDYIRVNPLTQCTTTVPYYSAASAAGLVFFDKYKNALSGVPTAMQGGAVYTFTTPADCSYVRFSWNNANGNEAQIAVGSESSYHTYAGNRYTITLGQTVYGGTLDVTAGTLTVEYQKYNITEFSGAWGAVRNGYAVYRTMYSTTNRFGLVDATPHMKSNRFKFEYVSREDASLFSYGGANGASVTQTFILPSSITSLAEANAWLADNPTDATFKLETPITIQLGPVTISTISGQTNNVWADAGDISVEFAADLKHYIDSKIAAAVAALS